MHGENMKLISMKVSIKTSHLQFMKSKMIIPNFCR